jgi:hypothetical protein
MAVSLIEVGRAKIGSMSMIVAVRRRTISNGFQMIFLHLFDKGLL